MSDQDVTQADFVIMQIKQRPVSVPCPHQCIKIENVNRTNNGDGWLVTPV